MADLVKELVTGIVNSVLKEILKKGKGKSTATKRKKRQTRSATTGGRFVKKTATAASKPARKQVSRRRTAAGRSKQRSR